MQEATANRTLNVTATVGLSLVLLTGCRSSGGMSQMPGMGWMSWGRGKASEQSVADLDTTPKITPPSVAAVPQPTGDNATNVAAATPYPVTANPEADYAARQAGGGESPGYATGPYNTGPVAASYDDRAGTAQNATAGVAGTPNRGFYGTQYDAGSSRDSVYGAQPGATSSVDGLAPPANSTAGAPATYVPPTRTYDPLGRSAGSSPAAPAYDPVPAAGSTAGVPVEGSRGGGYGSYETPRYDAPAGRGGSQYGDARYDSSSYAGSTYGQGGSPAGGSIYTTAGPSTEIAAAPRYGDAAADPSSGGEASAYMASAAGPSYAQPDASSYASPGATPNTASAAPAASTPGPNYPVTSTPYQDVYPTSGAAPSSGGSYYDRSTAPASMGSAPSGGSSTPTSYQRPDTHWRPGSTSDYPGTTGY